MLLVFTKYTHAANLPRNQIHVTDSGQCLEIDLSVIEPGIERLQALADISRSRYVDRATEFPCTDCKSAQQCTTRGHLLPFPKLHPGPCSSVGIRPHTDRQTHRQTRRRRPWPLYTSRRMWFTRNV